MVEISSNDGITYQQYSRDGSGNINVELSNNDIELTGRITPEALAALGYVPEPVWRDAVSDPPPAYKRVLVTNGHQIQIVLTSHNGRIEVSFPSGWGPEQPQKVTGWLPLPALPLPPLPGKGEA